MAVTGMELGVGYGPQVGPSIAQRLKRMLRRMNGSLDSDPDHAVRASRQMDFASQAREDAAVEFIMSGAGLQ